MNGWSVFAMEAIYFGVTAPAVVGAIWWARRYRRKHGYDR